MNQDPDRRSTIAKTGRSVLALLPIKRLRHPPPVVGVLRLAGIIGQIGPLRRGLSLANLAGAIERAFKLTNLKAVALAVNSPGGSAVQSALIAERIRVLAEEKDVPVFAFAEDVAASGGYWLATAADEIYANENSLIGSIGVVSGGFGFPALLRRLGIERRLHTAGEQKAILDPFLAEKPDDVEKLGQIQADIHGSFKDHVRRRRGTRLKAADDELFSGAFWTGRRAQEMGLIDGIGDLRGIMRQRFGDDVKLRPVVAARPWWRRRAGRGADAAEDWTAGLLAAVEERLWWGRFGL
ncbi:MAG: S49 family peptidase [Rhodospirillales bacterium]|jgi:signal peptide peptidase SppA|nr:S49 family peptidase [Rhodospirillales bacterium]MDP6883053.1 S49 family peptidase [Rhodospirillales bacterium]